MNYTLFPSFSHRQVVVYHAAHVALYDGLQVVKVCGVRDFAAFYQVVMQQGVGSGVVVCYLPCAVKLDEGAADRH